MSRQPRISFTLDEHLHEKAKQLAEACGCSVSYAVSLLVSESLSNWEKPSTKKRKKTKNYSSINALRLRPKSASVMGKKLREVLEQGAKDE